MAYESLTRQVRVGSEREDTYDQIIRGGMESDECALGGGAADNYAVDPLLFGNYGLDETYDYDLFKTDGG